MRPFWKYFSFLTRLTCTNELSDIFSQIRPPIITAKKLNRFLNPGMSMVGRFVGQSDNFIPETYIVWDNYPTSSIAQYPIRQGPTGVGVMDFRLQRQGQRGGVSQMLHKFWCRKSDQSIDESSRRK